MSHRPSQRIRSLEWPQLLNGGRAIDFDETRQDYRRLRGKHCRRPDGTWIAELELEGVTRDEAGRAKPGAETREEAHAHPLGDDDDNPWKQYYASTLPTLEQILLDLSRLQLDEEPASSQGGNSSSKHIPTLARILFIWSLTHHEAPGYKQGMHDVASALLIVRTRDSSHPALDPEHIEADAYLLFSLLMQHIAPLYYPATIASYTDAVRSSLMQVDPALASHLQRIDVEPRLFLLRWLRLVFLRELPMEDCLELWDGVFDATTTKTLDGGATLQWVCVAALLRMRGRLLAGGQSEALAMLMKEWEVPPVDVAAADDRAGIATGGSQHHTPLLVRQALLLSSRPTPATGVQCTVQNQDMLGIPLRHAAPTSPDEDIEAAQTYPGAAAGSPFTSATLSRAAFAGAQKTAAWAYQNATIRMAAAAAAAAAGAYASPSGTSDRAGFPSGWDLGEVEARRLRRGKATEQRQRQEGKGEAGLKSSPLDESEHMAERDRKLALVLDGVLAKLQGKVGAESAVADEEALAALAGVRDVLAGKSDVAALGLDGVEADAGEAGSKSASNPPADPLPSPSAPRPPSAPQKQQQQPKSPPASTTTPTKPVSSPPARKSGHRAFARLPSPPSSKPTPSLVDDPLGALGGN